MYSSEYLKIKKQAKKWPKWKKEIYNNQIAINKHSKKIS